MDELLVALAHLPEHVRDDIIERAAIYQCDAHMSAREAESLAQLEALGCIEWLRPESGMA